MERDGSQMASYKGQVHGLIPVALSVQDQKASIPSKWARFIVPGDTLVFSKSASFPAFLLFYNILFGKLLQINY